MATNKQIQCIYSLGTALGIKGKGHDDMLHTLVYSITGKESVKELNDKEFSEVQAELLERMKLANPNHPEHKVKNKPKKTDDTEIGCNGMATTEQQNLCWRYIFRLRELDPNPDSASAYERFKGALWKVCGINIVSKKEPFRAVTQEDCSKLIEQLKRYVNTAERRAKRGEKCART